MIANVNPGCGEKDRRCSRQIHNELRVPARRPYWSLALAVRVTKPVAQRAHSLDDSLTCAEDLLEDLFRVLTRSAVEAPRRLRVQFGEVGIIGIDLSGLVENQLAYGLQEGSCRSDRSF